MSEKGTEKLREALHQALATEEGDSLEILEAARASVKWSYAPPFLDELQHAIGTFIYMALANEEGEESVSGEWAGETLWTLVERARTVYEVSEDLGISRQSADWRDRRLLGNDFVERGISSRPDTPYVYALTTKGQGALAAQLRSWLSTQPKETP